MGQHHINIGSNSYVNIQVLMWIDDVTPPPHHGEWKVPILKKCPIDYIILFNEKLFFNGGPTSQTLI